MSACGAPGLRECACSNVLGSNPVVFGMLGLCPMLAVSTSLAPTLSLGLITAATMALSAAAVSLARTAVPESVRLPFFMTVVATIVVLAGLALERHLPELRERLGIFLPLVITNCAVLARLEACAYRSAPALAVTDALSCGLGLTLSIAALAAVRSLAGTGGVGLGLPALQAGAGGAAGAWSFPFALTPAGGFIAFGLMAAAANAARSAARRKVRPSAAGTSAPRS